MRYYFSILLLLSLIIVLSIPGQVSAATFTKIDSSAVQGTHTEKVVYTFSCKYSYLGKKSFPLVVRKTFKWNVYYDKTKPYILRINGLETSQYRIITSRVKNLPPEVSQNIHSAYDTTRYEKYNGFLQKKGTYLYIYETFGKEKMPPLRIQTSTSVLKYYWNNLRPNYYKKWYNYA
jgi:hypothetical protein